MINKVWVFHEGCEYEGGCTSGLYTTKEKALDAAFKEAKEFSDSMIAWCKEKENLIHNPSDWELTEIKNEYELGYKVGSTVYLVYEMEVE